jgi:hypothetical protein
MQKSFTRSRVHTFTRHFTNKHDQQRRHAGRAGKYLYFTQHIIAAAAVVVVVVVVVSGSSNQ